MPATSYPFADALIDASDDLHVAGTSLYLDAHTPRPLSVVTHAHSDHIARHGKIIATPVTLALTDRRIGLEESISLPFGQTCEVEPGVAVTLHPAGHILGSAMSLVQTSRGSVLYTGDFKLRSSLTVEAARPVPADVLIMESTYGLPFFQFPPWQQTAERLVNLVGEALQAKRQPIVMGYSLGKAQEITRVLTDAGFVVTAHGAVANMSAIYDRFGVPPGPVRKYVATDFHGKNALDLAERGVLVAPPQVTRSSFVSKFDQPLRVMMSGWGLLKNSQFRYGVDHVLPLSDHADFDELLELIEIVKPREVLTVHGYAEFVDHLRHRGINARLAKGTGQMELFG